VSSPTTARVVFHHVVFQHDATCRLPPPHVVSHVVVVALQPQAKTAAASAVRCWCGAIGQLAESNPTNQQLFGTAAVRDALLALRSQVTSAEACEEWCSAICNLTASNPANQQLFATATVRDALVALHRLATTPEACVWWAKAIWKLAGEAPAHAQLQLLGTAAIRDALVAVGSVIARFPVHHVPAAGGACLVWCAAVFALTDKDAANRALFRCDALLKVHAALKNTAATHPEPTHWWTCAGSALQRP
jgi:hypothetical protein